MNEQLPKQSDPRKLNAEFWRHRNEYNLKRNAGTLTTELEIEYYNAKAAYDARLRKQQDAPAAPVAPLSNSRRAVLPALSRASQRAYDKELNKRLSEPKRPNVEPGLVNLELEASMRDRNAARHDVEQEKRQADRKRANIVILEPAILRACRLFRKEGMGPYKSFLAREENEAALRKEAREPAIAEDEQLIPFLDFSRSSLHRCENGYRYPSHSTCESCITVRREYNAKQELRRLRGIAVKKLDE